MDGPFCSIGGQHECQRLSDPMDLTCLPDLKRPQRPKKTQKLQKTHKPQNPQKPQKPQKLNRKTQKYCTNAMAIVANERSLGAALLEGEEESFSSLRGVCGRSYV